jgi:hypothetical protein
MEADYRRCEAHVWLDWKSFITYRGRELLVLNVHLKWNAVRSTRNDPSATWYCRSFDQALEILWKAEERHAAYRKHIDEGGCHKTFIEIYGDSAD